MADDVVIKRWQRSTHSGNTFTCATTGREIISKLSNGPHTLKGIAEYRNGTKLTGQIAIVLDSSFIDRRSVPSNLAAITFQGRGQVGRKIKLSQDGKRGDQTLTLQSTQNLRPGDCLYLEAPATTRWKKLTKNACKWGLYRCYEVSIKNIKGNVITLNQPLRIEFPTVDGAFVRKIVPIQHCGIEDLSIEQKQNLWISSVLFHNAWNCWAKGVKVKMCGRFPVYGHQWAASGNVIRKGVFHDSDGQWHAGWTNENLIEQCVIKSVTGHGGYGFGMWASPPEDTAHGPNGPRNVVYNCDVTSVKTGLWMGGMNENWMILHNRFTVQKGYGVFAKTASFDHIIKDNVFILKDKSSPMVFLASQDCIGVEITGNLSYGGNAKITAGSGKPVLLEDNRALPLTNAPRPKPKIPSIYEWQNAQPRK
jgi:hypothetical protein